MSKLRMIFGSRRTMQLALAGMTAASLAGCADSDRFSANPLGNPFSTASADRTDRPRPDRDSDMPIRRSVPSSAISSRPLAAPVQSSALPMRQQAASYAVPAHESPRLAQAPAPSRTRRDGLDRHRPRRLVGGRRHAGHRRPGRHGQAARRALQHPHRRAAAHQRLHLRRRHPARHAGGHPRLQRDRRPAPRVARRRARSTTMPRARSFSRATTPSRSRCASSRARSR